MSPVVAGACSELLRLASAHERDAGVLKAPLRIDRLPVRDRPCAVEDDVFESVPAILTNDDKGRVAVRHVREERIGIEVLP